MKITISILFFVAALVLLSISCSKKTLSANTIDEGINIEERVKQVALTKFESNYKLMYNESRNKVCIYKSRKSRSNDIYQTISFVIYDPKTDQILFEEKIARAECRWVNDKEFEVIVTPGIVRSTDQAQKRMIYNTDTKKKSVE